MSPARRDDNIDLMSRTNLCSRRLSYRVYYAVYREDNFEADVYPTTPIMSTYLLAFIVCDFDYKEITTANGVEVSILNVLYRLCLHSFSSLRISTGFHTGARIYFAYVSTLKSQRFVHSCELCRGEFQRFSSKSSKS
jgi:hypothetical protein